MSARRSLLFLQDPSLDYVKILDSISRQCDHHFCFPNFSVHVLTEEPDDDQNSEEEEEEEETIGGTANEEEVEVAEGQRRSSRVASGSEVKNFLRLQTEEFDRTVLKAREKDTSGERGNIGLQSTLSLIIRLFQFQSSMWMMP